MKALLDFIVDILKVPSVLVGLIALIGLIAQKKPIADTIKGTIKTILGFIVLGGGAGVLLGSLNPLGDIFQQAFNVQGVVPNNEAIVSTALEKYGTATAHHGVWHGGKHRHRPLHPSQIHLPHRPPHLLHGVHDCRHPRCRRL